MNTSNEHFRQKAKERLHLAYSLGFLTLLFAGAWLVTFTKLEEARASRNIALQKAHAAKAQLQLGTVEMAKLSSWDAAYLALCVMQSGARFNYQEGDRLGCLALRPTSEEIMLKWLVDNGYGFRNQDRVNPTQCRKAYEVYQAKFNPEKDALKAIALFMYGPEVTQGIIEQYGREYLSYTEKVQSVAALAVWMTLCSSKEQVDLTNRTIWEEPYKTLK